jgi:hypothetical protein
MAQPLYTIDEYIATVRKRTSIWIVFNTVYNDVHAFNKEFEGTESYLNKKYTDYKAQKEFVAFMQECCADVKILQVFDLVSSNHIIYPYLGSYAIDIDPDSFEYKKIIEKYGDPYDELPPTNNAVIWVMSYEEAQKFYEERKAMLEGEF